MAHLKNKTIREFNEKDLNDRLKQARTELFKLRIESRKGTLRKESGKLKPLFKSHPTYTIVQLSLRLADKMFDELNT